MERSTAQYRGDKFEILAEINHDDTFDKFIGAQIKKRSFTINIYLVFMFVLSWVLISIFISIFSGNLLYQLGLGVFSGLLLIPLHELLHGVYLRALGCNSIDFEWDLFKFRFSCFSNGFVLSKNEYHLFLLAPFITITASLLLLVCFYSQFAVFFLSMLLMHSSMSAGDFSLVNFSVNLNRNQLFIYYDHKVKKTMFLACK